MDTLAIIFSVLGAIGTLFLIYLLFFDEDYALKYRKKTHGK